MKPFFKSVKFRLTLWYALVLALLLTVFGFFTHTELKRALYRDADQKLSEEARVFEDNLSAQLKFFLEGLPSRQTQPQLKALEPEQLLSLQSLLVRFEIHQHLVERSTLAVRIVGWDHTEFLSNLSGWQRGIIFPDFERDSIFMEKGKSFQTIHYRREPMRLYYHLVTARNYPLFVLQVGMPLTEVQNSLKRLSFIILISIPGAVVAACVAGWFLAKRSFAPVDLMIREARQITAAYLKGRLPRSGAGDEVDRLAGTINEMMDRVESSTRAVQDFSSDISHELRTPLAIIRGEIDLALRKSRTPEELGATLRVIEGEVNELIRLVDDLMLLVRSDARQLRFDKKRVSLENILDSTVERFRERARGKSIDLILKIASDILVKGDDLYLKRMFSNLIDNAIKFTLEGGKIEVIADSTPQHARITVTDSGMGIELEMQAKVFSRFYRTDQARSHEGSGLGLNIAKAICDGHEGIIKIESQPGLGTQVTVLLPLV